MLIDQLCDRCKTVRILRTENYNYHQRREQQWCTPCKEDSGKDAFKDGYECGYTWLPSGPNFKHPKAQGGYIPGGPIFWNDPQSVQINNWYLGFRAGINQYVTEKGLNWPLI